MFLQTDDENSDLNVELKIDNDYAKNYDEWRQKEELHKLKKKYGEGTHDFEDLNGDFRESSDDELNEPKEFHENFLKVFSLLCSKDPKIHDQNVSFFDKTSEGNYIEKKKQKSKRNKIVTLRDHERTIILERHGKYSESEDGNEAKIQNKNSLTYVQEQEEIKKSFGNVLKDDDDDDDDLLVVKDGFAEQVKKEKPRDKWLREENMKIDPQDEALKPLWDFWSDPNLDEGDKFLRDYILERKYLDENATNADGHFDHRIHDSDENLSEDEKTIERQDNFEYKYNYRFEEPDQEFIKRYPRMLEKLMRKKNTRRAKKRTKVKERKEEEKLCRKEELKQLRALKRKDIEEKLEKLKEITGNDDIMLNMADLEGDFDPNEYDQKMREVFNEDYYTILEGGMKPRFPEIDEEMDLGFKVKDNEDDTRYENGTISRDCAKMADCGNPNFIMDADYDPIIAVRVKKMNSLKKKKKGYIKGSKFIPREKPKFDPRLHSTIQEYLDRYYALDYEDIIGDTPCRFKLRKSVPNSYGLTIEEILLADDRELNKWCSLKKALELKPEGVEKNEVRRFQQKARNGALKRRILKSIYGQEESESKSLDSPRKLQEENCKNQMKNIDKVISTINKDGSQKPSWINDNSESKNLFSGAQKRKHKDLDVTGTIRKSKNFDDSDSNGIGNKKSLRNENSKGRNEDENQRRNVLKRSVHSEHSSNIMKNLAKAKKIVFVDESDRILKERKKSQEISQKYQKVSYDGTGAESTPFEGRKKQEQKESNKFRRRKKFLNLKERKSGKEAQNILLTLSNDRLKAYGTNPKKFKNRLMYEEKT